MSHDTLMFITNRGQLYWLKVYKIPEGSRTAKGKAVVNLISLQPDEKIKAIIPTSDFDASKSLAFFTKNGLVKRTNLSEYKNIRTIGVRAIKLDENDELVTALIIQNEAGEVAPRVNYGLEDEENPNLDIEISEQLAQIKDEMNEILSQSTTNEELSTESEELSPNDEGAMLLIITRKGMCVKFRINKVRQMGRISRGVTGIRFKEAGDFVVGATFIESNSQEILSVSQNGIGKRTTADEYRLTNRGGKGVICMRLTDKTGDLIGAVMVDENMDLMALTTSGKMIRTDMQSIRKAGRNTSGVRVVNVDGESVVSIACCPKEEKDEEIFDENGELIASSDEISEVANAGSNISEQ